MRKAALFSIFLFSLTAPGFTVVRTVRPEPYFNLGKKISFKITAENGAVSYSEYSINTIQGDNGKSHIYASDQRLDDHRKTTFNYQLEFYNDSVNWCVKTINHLNIPAVYSSNYIVSLRSDSLVYPYAMKVGDTLLPGSASELIIDGTRNERFIIINQRKVVASETGEVNGKIVTSYRIQSVLKKGSVADYGALGKIPTETTYDFTEWFVPSMGVVKTVLKSKTGETAVVQDGFK